MELGLESKVAAVAAASSGLGHAVALDLAKEGASVFICSRDDERVRGALESIRRALGGTVDIESRVQGAAVDLNATDGPERFVQLARERFSRVDILVANNGGPPPGPPIGLGDEAWEAGYRGTFASSRKLAEAVIPSMRRQGWGRILFITSISVKQPIEGLAISTAMRAAVVGYAKMLSDDLAKDGITVNCVAPGSTHTARLESLLQRRAEASGKTLDEMKRELESRIPARRLSTPAEFSAPVVFLVSERASYITGTVLAVDGGAVRSLT